MLATGTPPKGVIKKPTDKSGPAHGLTKREWFAGMALQGELASQGSESGEWHEFKRLRDRCYEIADAMLKQGDE